ncbi:MAG: hypothetical protein IJ678_05945, partial [Kiritimatiellae bacterium]|nr:hypothetical protein [Kiritimatiellia bacterium]
VKALGGGFGGAPIAVRAESMEFFYNLGSAIFEGGVVVSDPEFRLEADKALVRLDSDRKLKRVDCDGRVRATGNGATAKCGHATYSADDSSLVMAIEPSVSQDGRTVRGDALKLDLDTQIAEAEGHAVVEAHPDSFRGAAGRRPEGAPASTLSADRIRYDRPGRKAEARGRVSAVDVEATLQADRMDAFFTDAEEVYRIEADGNVDVRVADPQPEKGGGDIFATGRHATYDRNGALATLTGDPLVRRGGQTVRGEPLYVDLQRMTVSAKGFAGSGRLPEKGKDPGKGTAE